MKAIIRWSIAGALGITACVAWLAYVTQGIGYEDLLGAPGQEAQLQTISAKASASLTLALTAETLTISWIFWLLTANWESVRRRLVTVVPIGIVVAGFTYFLLRPGPKWPLR